MTTVESDAEMARRLYAELNGVHPPMASVDSDDEMARRLYAELNGNPITVDSDAPITAESDDEMARRLYAELNGDPITVDSDAPITAESDDEMARRLYAELNGDPITVDSDTSMTVDSDAPMTVDSDAPMTVDSDDEMARRLYAELNGDQPHMSREEIRVRRIQQMLAEEKQMRSSPAGKALALVRDVLGNHLPENIKALARDDMVYMAERFFEFRNQLAAEKRPVDVRIVWHWTHPASLTTIQQHGLLTREDQTENGAKAGKVHGAVFGSGIYVANNPKWFRNYGTIGLACLAMIGKPVAVRFGSPGANQVFSTPDVDTTLGNKTHGRLATADEEATEIVLRRSAQILPIYTFTRHEDTEPLHILLGILRDDYFSHDDDGQATTTPC